MRRAPSWHRAALSRGDGTGHLAFWMSVPTEESRAWAAFSTHRDHPAPPTPLSSKELLEVSPRILRSRGHGGKASRRHFGDSSSFLAFCWVSQAAEMDLLDSVPLGSWERTLACMLVAPGG